MRRPGLSGYVRGLVDVCVVTYGNTADRVKRELHAPSTTCGFGTILPTTSVSPVPANELARQGTDDIIVFVNPDGDPWPGCFDALERCFDNPEVVAAEASQGPASGGNRDT